MIDVVIVTYGEPAGPDFYPQWEYSSRILRKLTRLVAPIPSFAVPLIGGYRAFTRWRTWKAMGYQSPLEPITRQQLKGLYFELSHYFEAGTYRVHLAYEFREPTLEDVLVSLSQADCERLIIIPMYLAVSDFTTGLPQRDYQRFKRRIGCRLPKAQFITFRPYLRELAGIMAAHVRRQTVQTGGKPGHILGFLNQGILHVNMEVQTGGKPGLLLGCHGTVTTPLAGIEDTGYQDTFDTYRYLEEELRGDFSTIDIGWMNHRKGGEWTQPELAESARKMKDAGVERIVYFPFGFLADNAETQLESQMILHELGIETYQHLSCLDAEPVFIRFLSKIIAESILALND